jgi:hypothetical protein
MQAIVQDQGAIGAGPDTGENDDLVSALVLAHHTWIKWYRDGLVARGLTWGAAHIEPPKQADMGLTMSWIVSEHWRKVNEKARSRRERF